MEQIQSTQQLSQNKQPNTDEKQHQNQQQTNSQTTSLEDTTITSTKQVTQLSSNFLRLKILIKNIQDPTIKFGAILGAGISVSAGYSAFRSKNSVFQAMQHDYDTWLGKDDSEDSFLGYAFSVSSLRNDPRIQYRVLHRFDKSMHDHQVAPTLSHMFLQYLAEQKKLVKVVTQNIDDLEIDVGLGQQLGKHLIQAHGSFSQSPICVNDQCPGFLLIKEQSDKGNFHQSNEKDIKLNLEYIYKQDNFKQSGQTHKFESQRQLNVLCIDPLFLRFHPQIFLSAVYDNSVPCCPYCGVALKPSMVLYEEEINLSQELQKKLFEECRAVLIVGTSLNVEPVSHLPAFLTPDTFIHIIAKEVNFQKYLTECLEDQNMFNAIIQQRFDKVKYKSGDESRAILMKYLLGEDTDNKFSQRTMNLLTPYFNYHQGESDQLIEELLQHLPTVKTRIEEIKLEVLKNSKYTRQKPNYSFNDDQCQVEYKYLERTCDSQLVLLSIPQLWQPDAAIYSFEEQQCYATACLLLREQYQLVLKMFAGFLRKQKVTIEGQEYEMLIDTRYTDIKTLDNVLYLPIGGHWSVYCIAYNCYSFQADRYRDYLDPWSANFMGYQRKGIFFNKFTNFFSYQGVWRNFYWMHKNSPTQMKINLKMSQHILKGEDYCKLINPILFEQKEDISNV